MHFIDEEGNEHIETYYGDGIHIDHVSKNGLSIIEPVVTYKGLNHTVRKLHHFYPSEDNMTIQCVTSPVILTVYDDTKTLEEGVDK
jgi:hypothetical protein